MQKQHKRRLGCVEWTAYQVARKKLLRGMTSESNSLLGGGGGGLALCERLERVSWRRSTWAYIRCSVGHGERGSVVSSELGLCRLCNHYQGRLPQRYISDKDGGQEKTKSGCLYSE